MATKLLVFASFVALTNANFLSPTAFRYNVGYGYASPAASAQNVGYGYASPAASGYNVGYGYASPAAPTNDSKTDAAGQNHADPLIIAVYDFHKTFLETQRLKPPYHYSYGYEVYNWKTGLTHNQYEIRYGDLAIGTATLRALDGSRSIVDYTVDTPNGFYGIIRRDFVGEPANFGYARIGGSLAYTSHPPQEEYASRTTLLASPGAIENSSPLAKIAYATHNLFINYFNLVSPFRYSFGYEAKDAQTGVTRSQYETYHGNIGEGSYTQIVPDGTRSSIDYSISPDGFAVTSPQTFALKANPEVHYRPLGYAGIYY